MSSTDRWAHLIVTGEWDVLAALEADSSLDAADLCISLASKARLYHKMSEAAITQLEKIAERSTHGK